jgi:hypothetical protein
MSIRSRSRAWVLGAAVAALPARALADDPPAGAPGGADQLDPLRDRFRAGMDRYRAGDFAGAIELWRGIYDELGPEKGYRLAYNIGRACELLAATHPGTPDAFREARRALEHYAAYVAETTRRREAGEALEPVLEKQEAEAKERLGSIVVEGPAGTVAMIDGQHERHPGAPVWVVPGTHVVVFRPGSADQEVVTVTIDVGTTRTVAPAPRAGPPAPDRAPRPSARFETRTERPYGTTILLAGAGATVLAAVLPVALYADASAVAREYESLGTASAASRQLAADYDAARTAYYVSWALPAVTVAATLAAYWLVGVRERRVPVALGGVRF